MGDLAEAMFPAVRRKPVTMAACKLAERTSSCESAEGTSVEQKPATATAAGTRLAGYPVPTLCVCPLYPLCCALSCRLHFVHSAGVAFPACLGLLTRLR